MSVTGVTAGRAGAQPDKVIIPVAPIIVIVVGEIKTDNLARFHLGTCKIRGRSEPGGV